MMALSLAACGGSSTTVTTPVVETPVVETPVVETPVVVAPVAHALSNLNAETLVGSAVDDAFTGDTTYYDAADQIVDSSTTDSDSYTLVVKAANASADSGDAGSDVEVLPIVTNVENVNVEIQSVAATEVSAANMTGVTNLTVTRGDLTVGDATIAGGTTVDIFAVDAVDVATVTIGAGTTTAEVAQATTAGITVDADNASGDVTVTGAATVSATGQGTGDTLTMTVLSDATQDAKAVDVTTGAEDVVIGAFTGTINVNAATAKSVDLAAAGGGVTIVAAGETGTVGAATTGIDVTGIDSSGANITTSYVGTSTAMGAIEITGTAATNDVATISSVGFTALDNDTTAVDTLNLSGNGAAATYTVTGAAATTITGSGDYDVNLAGNEAVFAGLTISGVNTIDLTAGTAGTIDADDWSSVKVDLGFDNAGNAISVGSDVTYEVTADQTTGLDFDFAAAANGAVSVVAGDDNGASTAVGTITVAALDANDGATSTGTLTIEASIANMSGTTITVGALQNIVATGDEDLTFTGVVTGASFDASASSGIMTLSGLTNGVSAITTGGGADVLTINHATTNHVVVTNAGNDTVTITATGTGSIVTGAGNDTINLDDVAGAYVVSSGVGNDTFVASGDVDAVMAAGEGTDILRIDATAALQNNANMAISGFETLDLDAALTLSAAQWANNSTINISDSSSNGTLNLGSSGSETTGITVDASGLTADTGASSTVTISGTIYADTLTGSALAETFTQTAGNDSIEGGSTGVDTLTLLAASTDVDGTLSGDVMNGNVVNMGTTAIDEATITSRLGNHIGEGATAVAAGSATFSFASGSAATTGSVNIAAVQTIGGIETVTGGTGEDYIVGDANNNTINGNAGDDYIDGGDGNDTVIIDSTAEYAADVYVGGLGTDTLSITGTTTLSTTDADISGFENMTITGASTVVFTGQTEGFTIDATAASAQNITTGTGADTIDIEDGTATDVDVINVTTTSGVDTVTGFDAAEDDINVDALTASSSFDADIDVSDAATADIIVAGQIYYITGASAGDADTAAASATEISASGVFTNATTGDIAHFVIVDNNSTAVYKYVEAGTAEVAEAELTLLATFDGIAATTDFVM